MQLLAPDILTDVVALTPMLNAFGYLVGLLVWMFGWRWHRFWIVWSITVSAGVIGLISGRALGGHMLVAALLLAIAGGMLAMELARLIAFVAGGLLVWLGARAVVPSAHDLTICFLLGGLVSLLLYRFWTMLLTSLIGSVLSCYCGLALLAKFLKMDVVAIATKHTLWLNIAIVTLTLLGLSWQNYLERRVKRKAGGEEKKEDREDEPEEKPKPKEEPKSTKSGGKGGPLRWLPFPRKAA